MKQRIPIFEDFINEVSRGPKQLYYYLIWNNGKEEIISGYSFSNALEIADYNISNSQLPDQLKSWKEVNRSEAIKLDKKIRTNEGFGYFGSDEYLESRIETIESLKKGDKIQVILNDKQELNGDFIMAEFNKNDYEEGIIWMKLLKNGRKEKLTIGSIEEIKKLK